MPIQSIFGRKIKPKQKYSPNEEEIIKPKTTIGKTKAILISSESDDGEKVQGKHLILIFIYLTKSFI